MRADAPAGDEQVSTLLVSVTCIGDGRDHRISDAALGEACRSGLVAHRTQGGALTVLNEVLTWDTSS